MSSGASRGWGRLGALAHPFSLGYLAGQGEPGPGGDAVSEWTRLQGPIPGLGGRETADIWRLVLRRGSGEVLGC